MKLSLVICTYNRVDILKLTLPSYSQLLVPKSMLLEIIVIDNNSTDGTASYVKNYIKNIDSNISYRYVFEEKQGISHARNMGFQSADGDYIAYADDECVLPKDWLETAKTTIDKHQPAFLGGPYYGKFLPGTKSEWFKESFGDSFLLQYKPVEGALKGRYLSSGNMLIRRDVFNAVGGFNPDLGMTGKTIAYGEEQDFQKRYIALFDEALIFYNPKLFVWHYIRNEKISMWYLFREALTRGQFVEKSKPSSTFKLVVSPILLIFTGLRAMFFFVLNFLKSLGKKEHFFTLLHEDYKKTTWRSIGQAWFHFHRLLVLPFSLFSSKSI